MSLVVDALPMDVEGEGGPAGKRTRLLEEEENGERRRDGGMEPTPPLLVKRLSEHAMLPARASQGAAGYDLYR